MSGLSQPGRVRVMIVDDHRIVREGLRQVLADYEVGPAKFISRPQVTAT